MFLKIGLMSKLLKLIFFPQKQSLICNDSILQEEFEHAMDMSTSEFALLYSFYSFPNMVVPIIGGRLIAIIQIVHIHTN